MTVVRSVSMGLDGFAPFFEATHQSDQLDKPRSDFSLGSEWRQPKHLIVGEILLSRRLSCGRGTAANMPAVFMMVRTRGFLRALVAHIMWLQVLRCFDAPSAALCCFRQRILTVGKRRRQGGCQNILHLARRSRTGVQRAQTKTRSIESQMEVSPAQIVNRIASAGGQTDEQGNGMKSNADDALNSKLRRKSARNGEAKQQIATEQA